MNEITVRITYGPADDTLEVTLPWSTAEEAMDFIKYQGGVKSADDSYFVPYHAMTAIEFNPAS